MENLKKKKIRYGGTSMIEKMEEAGGIEAGIEPKLMPKKKSEPISVASGKKRGEVNLAGKTLPFDPEELRVHLRIHYNKNNPKKINPGF